jgi:hypothetical protein
MSHCFVDIGVKCATPILMSLLSSIGIVFHPAFFSSILLVIITLTIQILEKKIMALSRMMGIMTRDFYTIKVGFKVLGDNIKVFYK